jgi:thiosulfate/3-mercaptopyruvate sulfurtransferase
MREIELEELVRRRGELVLVDVRSPEEFDGSLGAPCDPRQGHIPGALNLPLEVLLQGGDEDLRGWLAAPDGAEIVVYCHSGSRSGIAVGVLERLGYEGRNYRGSWHEWARTELPLE